MRRPTALTVGDRRRLLDGLAEAMELLADAGCRQTWLNGSFVTAKDEPGDFDACWDTECGDLESVRITPRRGSTESPM